MEERGNAFGALFQAPELESFNKRRHFGTCGSIVDLIRCIITVAVAASSPSHCSSRLLLSVSLIRIALALHMLSQNELSRILVAAVITAERTSGEKLRRR